MSLPRISAGRHCIAELAAMSSPVATTTAAGGWPRAGGRSIFTSAAAVARSVARSSERHIHPGFTFICASSTVAVETDTANGSASRLEAREPQQVWATRRDPAAANYDIVDRTKCPPPPPPSQCATNAARRAKATSVNRITVKSR